MSSAATTKAELRVLWGEIGRGDYKEVQSHLRRYPALIGELKTHDDNGLGNTAFHKAVKSGNREILNLLMSEDPQGAGYENALGETTLEMACRESKFPLIMIILNKLPGNFDFNHISVLSHQNALMLLTMIGFAHGCALFLAKSMGSIADEHVDKALKFAKDRRFRQIIESIEEYKRGGNLIVYPKKKEIDPLCTIPGCTMS